MRWITLTRFSVLAGAALLGLLSITSCGAGVAGVVAGSGGGGGTTVQPAIAAFTVVNPKKPDQATLRFNLSRPATVELLYRLPGDTPLAMTQAGANPRALPEGEQTLPWNFALESGLSARFLGGVQVFARIPGAQEQPEEGENALTLGLGNDAPVVERANEPPAPEVSGIVAVRVSVSDSSRDAVSIRAEFDVVGDDPDLGWQLARPGGLLPGETTPELVFTGVIAPASPGIDLDFFWNTDIDLADLERDARLRFTAVDPVIEGASRETGAFHVDNNAAPIVQLDSGPIITNPDERRGIPIPFRVIDEEGDMVEVIFQWRREDEGFPELPTDDAALDAILADPILLQEMHVCTPYPRYARGRVVPIDEDTVRLPELASSESWILASGLEGRTIELLRPSSIPAPITPKWRSNPLVSPVAALPVGDGLTALVLDVPGNGRLREVELATGTVVREIATLGQGIPSAMAFERGEKAVLVALDDAGTWRMGRVELGTGAISELAVSDGTELAPVRGIASLGTSAAVFTVGSSLFHIDYRNPLAPRLERPMTDLATPWGIAVDPLSLHRLYVAEREADRVLSVWLDSREKLPVVVKTTDMQFDGLKNPEAIGLARSGSRLLVMSDASGGGRRLVAIDLGAKGGNAGNPIGEPITSEVTGLATSPDGSSLLALPAENELLVGGGTEQRRSILAYDPQAPSLPSQRLVVVDPPFDPAPRPNQPWRILVGPLRLRATAQGAEGRFLWDSNVARAGRVLLRAIGRDSEVGPAAAGSAAKELRFALDVEPSFLGGTNDTLGIMSVAAADMDGDGDLDLVTSNQGSGSLTIFFQTGPGSFDPDPLLIDVEFLSAPQSVAAADVDLDGDLDVACALFNAGLRIFFQTGPGEFDPDPVAIDVPADLGRPLRIVAADLDGDGDPDLACVGAGIFNSGSLMVFFQTAPRFFDPVPLVLQIQRPGSVTAADLDGDGDVDLASTSSVSNAILVFYQTGPGAFDPVPLALSAPPIMVNPALVFAVDIDADGDADLVSANPGSTNLTIFFQSTPGDFDPLPFAMGEAPYVPGTIAAGDLDGDGDVDLVSTNAARDKLLIFSQIGPGVFDPRPLLVDLPARSAPIRVVAADLEGDGDDDLVTATASPSDRLMVSLHTARGNLDPEPTRLRSPPTMDDPQSIAAADLDGDGDGDLVSANLSSDNLTIFFQTSPRAFDSLPLALGGATTTDIAFSVAVADLDGDSDIDVVSANGGDDSLTIFFQTGPQSFESLPLVLRRSVMKYPLAIEPADLDGDGDLDLATANASSHNLTVWFQEDSGDFLDRPLVLAGFSSDNGPDSIAAGDLDGDGDIDLASGHPDLVLEDTSSLKIYYQTAPGAFQQFPLMLGGPCTCSLAIIDVDEDGDLDLFSVDVRSATAFLQSSSGSLGPEPRLLATFQNGSARSIDAADVDGDGDLDVVVAISDSFGNADNLTVLFQEAPRGFDLRSVGLSPSNSPLSVAAADLDGDGDVDIASANAGSDDLTVFWNGR